MIFLYLFTQVKTSFHKKKSFFFFQKRTSVGEIHILFFEDSSFSCEGINHFCIEKIIFCFESKASCISKNRSSDTSRKSYESTPKSIFSFVYEYFCNSPNRFSRVSFENLCFLVIMPSSQRIFYHDSIKKIKGKKHICSTSDDECIEPLFSCKLEHVMNFLHRIFTIDFKKVLCKSGGFKI